MGFNFYFFWSFFELDFGENFLPTAKKILSRIFRVYAHIYHCHWEKVKVF